MILKIMTRKEPTFSQLLAYVSRDATDARYVHTHLLMGEDLDAYAAEFEANARLLRKHQNGTVMFHEILSITRSKSLGLERQKEILKEIVQDYINRRAPGHFVYAGLHTDRPEHLHYHLVISANPVGKAKRAHLSKPQLKQLQTDMEARVLRLYPDLEQKQVMSHRRTNAEVLSQPGRELKRRTGNVPERQRVVDALTGIFSTAQTKDDLFRRLTDARMELYRRAKADVGRSSGTVGVRDLDTDRNHRLATLGLADAFKTMSTRIETAEEQQRASHHSAAIKTTAQQQIVLPQTAVQPSLRAPPSVVQQVPQAVPPPPTIRPSTPNQPTAQATTEDAVNIFEAAISVFGAVTDALSINSDTGKPLAKTTNNIRTAVHTITTAPTRSAQAAAPPAASQPEPEPPPQITDHEREAAQRLQEMADFRESQEDKLGDQRGSSLKR